MIELVTRFCVFDTREILVQSFRVNKPKTIELLKVENLHNYNVLCAIKGKFKVFCSGKTFELSVGDIFVAMPFENFNVVYVGDNAVLDDDNKPIISNVSFSSNYFEDVVGDVEYLRVFNKRKKGEQCLYKAKDFNEKIQPIGIFSFLKYCVDRNLGLVHFSSALGALITVLDTTYDKMHGDLSSVVSDEYDVKIWDYILNNSLNQITAETVQKEFNISKWYLDKVTNKFYGKPFKKTVNALRMWRAKTVMKEHVPLSSVASYCGFANYSTFYRAYTSFFGVNPKEDYLYYKTHFIFYSDDANKSKKDQDTF